MIKKRLLNLIQKEWLYVTLFITFLTSIFFYQAFLGKIPVPSDVITGMYHPWLDYKWGGVTQVPVKNSMLSDAVTITYPLKLLAVNMIKSGQVPLWNSHSFAGYPLLASSTAPIFFPTMLFYLILPFNLAYTLQIAAQPFMAFLSMYFLMRHFKLDKLSSIFSGISYGFGGFILVLLEWNSPAATSAFLPLLVLLMDNLLEKRDKFKWGALFGLALSLQVFAGYLPVVVFTLITLIAYFLIKGNYLKNITPFVKYYLFGLFISSVYLIPYSELIINSQRFVENIGAKEALTSFWNIIGLAIPDFFGNPTTGNSWGNGNYLNVTVYIGVIGLIFAIMGAMKNVSKKEVKFSLIILSVAALLMYENPVSKFIYNLGIWGGSSNTLNRFAFVINFALSILAGFGFSSINKFSLSSKVKTCLFILFSIVGINLLFLAIYKLNLSVSLDVSKEHLMTGLRNSVLPTVFTLLVMFLMISDHKYIHNDKITKSALIGLLVIELFHFGLKFNTFSSAKYLYPETPVSEFLKNFPNDRIVSEKNILPANTWTPYGFESLGGYDAAYPLNIAKFIAVSNWGNVEANPQTKSGSIDTLDSKLLGDANTRFILVKKDSYWISKLLSSPDNKYKLVFEDKSIAVIENMKSLPRAYFVPKVIKLEGDKALSYIMSENDARGAAVTDNYEFEGNGVNRNSKIIYSNIANDHLQIKTSNSTNSFLVISNTYFPGWSALIDKIPTKIHRTNYAFMGLAVPAGEHTIDLVYKSMSFYIGLLISTFSVLILVGAVFVV